MAAFDLEDLERHLRDRLDRRPADSYTVALADDIDRLERKVVEEAFEFALEIGRPERINARVAEEAADLLFHLIVALVRSNVSVAQVLDVLAARRKPV